MLPQERDAVRRSRQPRVWSTRRAGESIAEVAEAEGVERQAVIDALVAAGTERLATAVAEGRITQERADQATERLPDLAARLVDHTRG